VPKLRPKAQIRLVAVGQRPKKKKQFKMTARKLNSTQSPDLAGEEDSRTKNSD
jgi:hypothetical protein